MKPCIPTTRRRATVIALELVALSAGIFFSLATSQIEPPLQEARVISDDTWVVSNVYDGQTAVSTDLTIRLAIGSRDLDSNGLDRIQLMRAEDRESVPFNRRMESEASFIDPVSLAPDTAYILDVSGLSPYLTVTRRLPGPITFSTGSAPKVTGLWRNEDTLIISFSEPMNPATLQMNQASIDLIWLDDDGEVRSLASDTNLANYTWDTSGELFMMAPVPQGLFWIKVAAEVRSNTGVPLDGNANGIPGESEDDFLLFVNTESLNTCFTREDIPVPCVDETVIE